MRFFLIGLTLACSVASKAAEPNPDLFAGYDKKEPVPEGLRKAYTAFAGQAKKGERVDSYLLPHSAVSITDKARPEKHSEYGRDINIPFLKERFAPAVFSVRKDPDDCYLIRTATTAIWYVETKSGAWKIYSYLDKPIE